MSLKRFAVRTACAAAVVSMLSACGVVKHAMAPAPDDQPLKLSESFSKDAPAETVLSMDWSNASMFVLRDLNQGSAALPDIKVKGLSFTEMGVMDALRILGAQSGLTVRAEGGALGSERYGPVVMENLSGSMTDVLNEMADAVGFFWELKGKTLIIRPDSQFIVNLPPVLAEDTLAGVTNTLQYLGARDVYLDRAGRTLTFNASKKGMDQIQKYLDNLRETRSLLIYDTHVFQVDLSEGENTGINWNLFQAGMGVPAAARVGRPALAATVNSAGAIGLSLGAEQVNIGAVLSFLKTQGKVTSLSSPQITLLSGSSGSLRVGKTIQFVSKVGSNTTTGISQVTTETTSLRTGLALNLFGDLYDQSVFTRVKLSIADVYEWVKYTAIGTDLTLPQSADRDLDVSVRSRPGDVVLLGGIHVDTDSRQANEGVAGFGNNKTRARSELVLVLKARLVRFVGKDSVKAGPSAKSSVVELEDKGLGLKGAASLAPEVMPDRLKVSPISIVRPAIPKLDPEIIQLEVPVGIQPEAR